MTVRLTRKHSKVEMSVSLTRVNVCVNTFIAIASLLIYWRFNIYITKSLRTINFCMTYCSV